MVEFKNLRVSVDEESIAEAIGVPAQGEKWFKQQDFQGNYGEFLLPGFEKLDWKKWYSCNQNQTQLEKSIGNGSKLHHL